MGLIDLTNFPLAFTISGTAVLLATILTLQLFRITNPELITFGFPFE